MKITMMSYTLARGPWGKNPDIVDLCRLTRELGLEAVDWVTTYGHDAAEVRGIMDDHGLVTSAHTFPAALQDPSQRDVALDAVKRGCEVAQVLGTDVAMVIMRGLPGVEREENRRRALDGLAAAVEVASPTGVRLTVEHLPGPQSLFGNSAEMNAACAAIPGLKITYDNGNVHMNGEPSPDGYAKSAADVINVHFKDWVVAPEGLPGLDGRTYRAALIGEGEVDTVGCLKAMRDGGYSGWIDFEYEGSDYDPAEGMRRGVPWLMERIEEVMGARV